MSFAAVPRQGYILKIREDSSYRPKYQHKFFGNHDIRGAVSPNTGKPLVLFLTIDLNDRRVSIPRSPIPNVFLLYSWRCYISQGDFYYQIDGANSIKILEYQKGLWEDDGPNCSDFPYEPYPEYFPEAKAQLVKVSERYQAFICSVNTEGRDAIEDLPYDIYRDVTDPKHQLGGEPYLIQGFCNERSGGEARTCPICRQTHPFFATVADYASGGLSLCGNSCVQVVFHYCPRCQVVGAYHECD
jgi:hypothetical protein